MDKKYGILIIFALMLILSFVSPASAANWSVDGSGGADFTRIQDAINNASDGDTIIVHSGIYYENVDVDKSVTLKGNGQPVVDANGSDSAITLTADEITLVGFTVTNSGSSWSGVGIKVTSNNNSITGNNVYNNSYNGIYLIYSSNNSITGNNVSNNDEEDIIHSWGGISLTYSSNNTITGNNVCDNNWGGIRLSYSSNNTISGNKVSNNSRGGIILEDSSNNTITGNNNCNNEEGIRLCDSSNNNTIIGNNVSNNSGCGIRLWYSSSNRIYFNNFINNTDNVDSSISTTIWNSPLEISYTYDGTKYKSYLGNYWDDYEGTDTDGDGIGDTHFSIGSKGDEKDNYPLMKPFENYILPRSAPA